MVSRGVNSPPPYKNTSLPMWLAPPYDDFKTLPHLFAPPSPINMATMATILFIFMLLSLNQCFWLFSAKMITVNGLNWWNELFITFIAYYYR